MPRHIKVVGFDPSLRNWGIAIGTLDVLTHHLYIDHVDVACPVLNQHKQVRQNSLDIEAAYQLTKAALAAAKGAQAVFVEVPVGSQNARAMASYGVCAGILGALRTQGVPLYELTPTEVKMAAVQKKEASKKQMIAWATKRHPEANWPTYKSNGKEVLSEAKAEHQADAVAAIHAGIASIPFQQLLSLQSANQQENHHADPTQAI